MSSYLFVPIWASIIRFWTQLFHSNFYYLLKQTAPSILQNVIIRHTFTHFKILWSFIFFNPSLDFILQILESYICSIYLWKALLLCQDGHCPEACTPGIVWTLHPWCQGLVNTALSRVHPSAASTPRVPSQYCSQSWWAGLVYPAWTRFNTRTIQ